NAMCKHGGCVMGFEDCNGDPNDGCEAELDNDILNCGGCFNECPQPQHLPFRCAAGMCEPGDCDMDYADCDGDPFDGCEVSLQDDVNNCGKCGNLCVAPPHVLVTCEMGI